MLFSQENKDDILLLAFDIAIFKENKCEVNILLSPCMKIYLINESNRDITTEYNHTQLKTGVIPVGKYGLVEFDYKPYHSIDCMDGECLIRETNFQFSYDPQGTGTMSIHGKYREKE